MELSALAGGRLSAWATAAPRNGTYSERELETWQRRIDGWRQRMEVFAYFNNDWQGYAVRNGLWLKERLSDVRAAA